VSQISFHSQQAYLAVQSHDRSVEVFRIRTEEEIRKKQLRRAKRAKEKKQQKQQELSQENDKQADINTSIDQQDADEDIKLVDQFTPYLVIRTTGKIRSFNFGSGDGGVKGGAQVGKHLYSCFFSHRLMLFCSFALRCLAMRWKYTLFPSPQNPETHLKPHAYILLMYLVIGRTCARWLSVPMIRSLLLLQMVNSETCLSFPAADSASKAPSRSGTPKQQRVSGQLNADMQYVAPSFPGIAMSVFLFKRRTLTIHLYFQQLQIAIGTKSGEILLYDLASSSLIETIQAHTATVWSLHVRPDQQALVSGGADKDVKFWEFERKDATGESVHDNHSSLDALDISLLSIGSERKAAVVGPCTDFEND
jgi:U3 small nucleolar RNA-associated protein 12